MVSGYIKLEQSIVRDVAELKRQKVNKTLIQSSCQQKVTALYDQAFEAASSMTMVVQSCTNNMKKELRKVLDGELEK